MTEFDENRFTDLFEAVCHKVLGEEAWESLSMDNRRKVKQGWLPIILAIDEFRDGEAHKPKRGDDVEAYLRRQREEASEAEAHSEVLMLDNLLDDYRLHADTGTPLSMDAVEGPGEPL